VIMIAVTYWLFRSKAQFEFLPEKYRVPDRYLALGVGLASLATPFILNPVNFSPPQQFDKSKTGYVLDLSKIYSNTNPDKPDVDLRNGKHILALMTLSCPHCRAAAFKMHVMKERHPEIPFYFLLAGNAKKYLDDFYDETQSRAVDHLLYNSPDFSKLAGGEVPAIYWLEDGKVVNRSTLYSLDEKEIVSWIEKK
jgi:hypothetical protein